MAVAEHPREMISSHRLHNTLKMFLIFNFVSEKECGHLKKEERKRRKWRKQRGSILRRQRLASPLCLDVSHSDHLAGSTGQVVWAEWSEWLTSRQSGLARRCRRRIDPRCFLHCLLFLHFLLFLNFPSLSLLIFKTFPAISSFSILSLWMRGTCTPHTFQIPSS